MVNITLRSSFRIFCRFMLLIMPFAMFSPGIVSESFAAGGDILWQRGDLKTGAQEAQASIVDPQGNFLVTGYRNLAGGTNDDYYTAKFKADGSGIAWSAFYDRAGGSDKATAIVVDAANDVIVTGYAWNGTNKDIHTIKYSGATGAVLWQHTWNGAANGNDLGTSISVDSLNNVYVGGTTQNASGNDDLVILKYSAGGPDPGGDPLWTATYNGAANGADQLYSLAAGIDGLAVTGQSWNGTSYDLLTIKYGFDGSNLWERRYSSGAGYVCSGKQVKMDAGGNVIISGTGANNLDLDIYTAKYNGATGAIVWERTYNGAFNDEPNGLYVDAGGDVYVTGYTWTLSGTNDFYTARYAGSNGAIVWQQNFDSGDGHTDVAIATGIAVDEAGDVFVTGYTVAAGNYDFQTIKYKRDNGNQLWHSSFNGTAGKNDRPVGLGFSPEGDVLVGGWSDNGSDLDYYLIKYDAGALNPPTSLATATISSTSVGLSWADNSGNEDGFKIERKLGEQGTFAQIAVVGAGITTYTDEGLIANNYYYYRVRAYNATNGDSHYSNEARALTVFVNFIPPSWSYLYNNPDNLDDFANAIAVGPDNNPVVTGYSLRAVGGFDYYTLKLSNVDKSIIWSHLYDDADSEMDVAKCVAVDGSNNAIVSGYSQLFYAPAQRNINSIYTLKYPAAGPPELWHSQYNGPGAIDDRATAIATTTDAGNNIVVIGYGKNAAGNEDIYVVKYGAAPLLDELGNAVSSWAAVPFDGGGDDIPSAVAIGPDGSVYVTGYSETAPGSNIYNFFTAKYSSTNGALIWSDLYSVISGGDNRGNSIAIDTAGDVYVTGSAKTAAGNRDIYTIKYSGSGNTAQRIWERPVAGLANGDDDGVSVRIDPIDGAVIVAGTTLTGPGDHDVTLVRYNAAGDVVWQKSLQRPVNDDQMVAMAVDASGYIYVAGNTSNGATIDVISLIYDHEGALLGATTYNGAANGNDEASSIAVNYQGEAFIAGNSANATGNADYLVIKQVNNFILVPAPFTATPPADYSRINLAWSNNTPGTGFRIERTLGPVTTSSTWTLINTASAGTTTFTDSGLNGNTRYCYRIEAYNGSLVSRKITTCATTTLQAPVLNQLSLVSATAVDVSWNNIPGNGGYRLERSSAGEAWTQLGGNLAADTVVYHDTGLTAGTVYQYRISTINSAGLSSLSNVQAAPVLSPLTGITATKIDLAWPAVAGATGYKVERSTDNSTWGVVANPVAAAVSHSDTTVAAGVLYYYRLRATSSTGDSAASLVQSGQTKLQTPSITSATAVSTTEMSVTWTDPNSFESGYKLEYSACYDQRYCAANPAYDYYWYGWTTLSLGVDGTMTSVTGLTPGNLYRFRVTAIGAVNSDVSPTVTARPNLDGPANLIATAAGETSVNLAWSDVLGENNYRVFKDGVQLSGVGLPLAQNATGYTVTGLSMNTPYCFKVQPYNGTSFADSNEACVTIYGPPTLNTVAGSGQNQTTLTWTDVEGDAGYEVWRSAATYQSSPPAAVNTGYWDAYVNATPTLLAANATTFDDTALIAGYTYKYKIRYMLSNGSFSAFSNELMATTVPPTPAIGTAVMAASQIKVSWSDRTGETGYNLQYRTRSGADCLSEDWTGVASAPLGLNSTYTTVTGLLPGTPYCFRLNATNGAGASPWSPIVTQTTWLDPPVLNTLTGITQSRIELSWNNVAGNTGYKIERKAGIGNWTLLATTLTDVAAYSDTTVAANTTYTYRVYVRNSANAYSVASNEQSATTLPITPPVLGPLSGITTGQIILSWENVADNAGYKVERSGDGTNWDQIATPAQGAVSHTDGGRSPGTLYYYRVSTRNSAGSYSVPSNVQSATTTPVAPVLASKLISESRIDLTWQVVYGATNYKIMRSLGSSGPWGLVGNPAIAYSTLYCGYYTTPTIGCPTLIPVYTTYADTSLTENVEYCYRMMAWNATGGDSSPSNVVCGKTPAVGAPRLVAVTPLNSGKIKLDWSYTGAACTPVPCENPDGFQIWRLLPTGEMGLVTTVPNTGSYTDTLAIEPQKTYAYQVRAYRGGDFSPFSNTLQATTPAYTAADGTCP